MRFLYTVLCGAHLIRLFEIASICYQHTCNHKVRYGDIERQRVFGSHFFELPIVSRKTHLNRENMDTAEGAFSLWWKFESSLRLFSHRFLFFPSCIYCCYCCCVQDHCRYFWVSNIKMFTKHVFRAHTIEIQQINCKLDWWKAKIAQKKECWYSACDSNISQQKRKACER